jgi:hypothetical protein
MRAHEFITEESHGTRAGKVSKRQQQSTVGLNVFAISQYDRTYDLNRVMMAVASTDGEIIPDMEQESWVGKQNTAHPYTQVEQDMLKIAYKAAGIPFQDLNKGDLDSEELDSANIESPMKPFKGYKK